MTTEFSQRFETLFEDFKGADLKQLQQLYDPGVEFRDPIQQISGLSSLLRYFEASRANVSCCSFEFDQRLVNADGGFFQWRMHYAHPRIQGGRRQVLRGVTMIRLQEKIVYHEDFYDLGAMLYEHVPVLGWAAAKIKRSMAES